MLAGSDFKNVRDRLFNEKPLNLALGTGAQSRGQSSTELLSNDLWLMDFVHSTGGFEKSYDMFFKEPTLMSTVLLKYTEQVYRETYKEAWAREVRAINRV